VSSWSFGKQAARLRHIVSASALRHDARSDMVDCEEDLPPSVVRHRSHRYYHLVTLSKIEALDAHWIHTA
jgi:hypothetical protein